MRRTSLALAAVWTLVACAPAPADDAQTPSVDASPTVSASPPAAAPAPADAGAREPPLHEAMAALSEPGATFLSDNLVSNETSYLDVAPALARAARPGGAYVGVGPEQSFTYLALTRPAIAFLVDIRRDNLILHLLYKATFEEATTRAELLALLVGRPWDAAGDPGPDARIEAVIAHAERLPATDASFDAAHARLRARVLAALGPRPDPADLRALAATHRALRKGGLDTRFELPASGRRYPRLRELLAATDPDGVASGFLASEASFRFVQRMQREGRVVPVVGDLAGDHAMQAIAAEIRRRGLTVSAFYVSNVEQYLFEGGTFGRYVKNVAALPTDDASLFVRAYLDQGRRHPAQRAGHRTATVLQPIRAFLARQAARPYPSFWAVATDAPAPP